MEELIKEAERKRMIEYHEIGEIYPDIVLGYKSIRKRNLPILLCTKPIETNNYYTLKAHYDKN